MAVKDFSPQNLVNEEGKHPTYPRDHSPGMRVPKGGSMCKNCKYVSEDEKHCKNKYFVRYHGSNVLPYPADEYCSDWYEPK